jgi:hypothetical protein
MGGLGNQLFQIFFLISQSIDKNKSFHFEPRECDRIDRPYYWNNFLSSLNRFIVEKSNPSIPTISEQSFHWEPIKHVAHDVKYFGYFQSYKYFINNENQIINIINFNEQQNNYKNIYMYHNTISLHFRLGDYVGKSEHHPILNIDYYKCAINDIICRTGKDDWNILYFCEEQNIKEVYEKINILQNNFNNISFEKIDNNYADWEQMLIMTLCQHNIIANSTFSWWGAYLNNNSEKLVYYPSVWFGPAQGNKIMNDLFPDNWNQI